MISLGLFLLAAISALSDLREPGAVLGSGTKWLVLGGVALYLYALYAEPPIAPPQEFGEEPAGEHGEHGNADPVTLDE